jgi:putative addiction module killer protein
MTIGVVEDVDPVGSNPFRRWFDRLDAQAAAKVATAVLRLELGNTSSLKSVGGVAEYRIDWGPGYRNYLGRVGDTLIILPGGGTKKGQQADIGKAKAMWAEYKLRRSAERARAKR